MVEFTTPRNYFHSFQSLNPHSKANPAIAVPDYSAAVVVS
jgi:hypothetical protein